MDNQNQFQSLMALLPDGKIENDIRLTDTTVTGICTVYLNRADGENAFFLRDIGVAIIGDDLTAAVRLAVDQAYGAAVSHLAAVMPVTAKQPAVKAQQETTLKTAPAAQQAKQEPAPAPASQAAPAAASSATIVEDGPERPPVDLGSIVDVPAQGVMTNEQVGENIERVDFTQSLYSKDAIVQDKAGLGEDDDADPAYQKALETEITIFGKLHVCNGWKAGRILAEQPSAIIDFCQRNSDGAPGPKYSGPKTDQKEALFKLYPDAVLKVQAAA
ncbi:MAG: hypothetical protein LBS19_03895 [Clostridiales bacterium]|jgi:hypothetical protein|nr:hypothetical protein [Clostridiales bacterium]